MVRNNFFDSKVISNWIHIINSKEEYQKLWDAIYKFRELFLGRYIIIKHKPIGLCFSQLMDRLSWRHYLLMKQLILISLLKKSSGF